MSPVDGKSRYVRAAEAVRLLSISRAKFYALQSENVLHRPKKCGRVSLWHREQLLSEFEGALR